MLRQRTRRDHRSGHGVGVQIRKQQQQRQRQFRLGVEIHLQRPRQAVKGTRERQLQPGIQQHDRDGHGEADHGVAKVNRVGRFQPRRDQEDAEVGNTARVTGGVWISRVVRKDISLFNGVRTSASNGLSSMRFSSFRLTRLSKPLPRLPHLTLSRPTGIPHPPTIHRPLATAPEISSSPYG